jgi:hypothetical protein
MASRAEVTNFIRHLLKIKEAFARDQRLSSSHISLYYALFFEWNESRFLDTFFINRLEMMNASKIGSVNTYTKCLKELDSFGYIKYLPSFNPNKGSMVNLFIFDNGTDKGSSKGTDKGSDKGCEQVVIPFNKHIKQNKDKKDNKGSKDGLLSVSNKNVDSIVDRPPKSEKIIFSPPSLKEEKADEISKTEARTGSSISQRTTFVPPELTEIKEFFEEKNKTVLEAEKFFNYFESNGWLVGGKTKMKNWHAAARNWIARSEEFNKASPSSSRASSDRLHVNQNKDYSIPL